MIPENAGSKIDTTVHAIEARPFTPIVPLESQPDLAEPGQSTGFKAVEQIIEDGIRDSLASGEAFVKVTVDGQQKVLGRFLANDLYKDYGLSTDEIEMIMDRYLNVRISNGEVRFGTNPNIAIGHTAVGATRERDFRELAAADDTLA